MTYRRDFLSQSGCGFGALALAAMLQQETRAASGG
ncbi:MAG: twin-arginine translocation signal domain-containing protein, partial [Planctomycetales bacterium]|nr:twin-arginine translocation signal domain-containing protein [Planctomycetales bacterium]